jgi:IclR family pca regulon transcriptional regulator
MSTTAEHTCEDRGMTREDPDGARNNYRVEALAKGLRVLSMFSEQRPAMRLSDVASGTGMLMPTVYRIAMTLAAEGFLEQLPDGRYRPGTKVLTLGFSALRSLDLVDIATGRLAALADQTRETVNLGVLSDDKVLYLVRFRNADLVTANIQVGSRLPAVYTSIGKVLLADLDEDALAARVDATTSFAGAGGPGAVPDLPALRAQLAEIRRSGYAVQDEEVAFGLRSVAAPIRGADGQVVAGANIAVNATQWSRARLLDELRPPLMVACAEISALLGHR